MFTKKDRKIANQKTMIKNRNKLINNQTIKIEQLEQENIAVHNENKDLRFEIEEQNDAFKEIIKLTEINTYNNEKAILSKIRELVNDYQSNH